MIQAAIITITIIIRIANSAKMMKKLKIRLPRQYLLLELKSEVQSVTNITRVVVEMESAAPTTTLIESMTKC